METITRVCFGSVNSGPRTAVAGVNVVGDYCIGLTSFRFLGSSFFRSSFSRHPVGVCWRAENTFPEILVLTSSKLIINTLRHTKVRNS